MGDGHEFEIDPDELPTEEVAPPSPFLEQANVTESGIRERFRAEWPDGWDEAGELLSWTTGYDDVYDGTARNWFPGGRLNAAANCLDRHLETRKHQRALVWDGQRGETRTYTYLELFREVNEFAAALREIGIDQGDVVTLHMPAVPELPIAMLACARIGAPHAVVYTGFSADALARRMDRSDSEYLVVSDGYYRRGDAVSLTNKAETVRANLSADVTTVVVDRFGDSDRFAIGAEKYNYRTLLDRHEGDRVDPVDRAATDELFVIYTSGTTGTPKRVTHTTGGYLVHTAWTSHAVLDLKPGDTYFCTADLGWITGHSYVVYGPLALGATVLLREGEADQPPRTDVWELIEHHAVDIFYTSPTAIRAFMKWGPEYPEQHDLSSLRLLGTVGEPINPQSWRWLYEHVGNEACPVVDTWWQTETGGHLVTTLPGVDRMKPGAVGPPLPGIDVTVVDEDGQPADANTGGYLVVDTPWPGMPRELSEGVRWAAPGEARPDAEWAYRTGDGAFVDDDGYVTILGRVDDVLNVSGRRFGTRELESTAVTVDGVTEAAVVSGAYGDRSHGLYVYVSLEDGTQEPERIRAEVTAAIEQTVGAFARPDAVIVSPELPKTSSGKIVRRLLTDIVNGESLGDTTALRNPEVLGEIKSAVEQD